MPKTGYFTARLEQIPGVVAIAGPITRLSGYAPGQLKERFGSLFHMADVVIVCQTHDEGTLLFSDLNKFAQHRFIGGGIVKMYAVPDLKWHEFVNANSDLEITDLRGPHTTRVDRLEPAPTPPPL